MSTGKKGLRFISIIIFSAGVLAGLAFAMFTVWANLEASMFDTTMTGDATLPMRCPVAITTNETGTVSAQFTNTADWDVSLIVNAHISRGYLIVASHERTVLDLAPGETQEVTWSVSPEDRVYGRFIFVRAVNLRHTPIPGRVGTCGILFVDIPFLTGAQFVTLTLLLTGLCLAGGQLLWWAANRSRPKAGRDTRRAMLWLTVIVTVDILCGMLRFWLPGAVVFFIAILLIVEVLRHYTQD
jgi:hypothetical protein